jgi:PleD family two-component response regulator
MGVASTEPSLTKMSTETLLSLSDAALYLAKQQGRDQFQIAPEQPSDKST